MQRLQVFARYAMGLCECAHVAPLGRDRGAAALVGLAAVYLDVCECAARWLCGWL
jgi:hypothetical protein